MSYKLLLLVLLTTLMVLVLPEPTYSQGKGNVYANIKEPWQSRLLMAHEEKITRLERIIATSNRQATELKKDIGRWYGLKDTTASYQRYLELKKHAESTRYKLELVKKNDPIQPHFKEISYKDLQQGVYGIPELTNLKIFQVVDKQSILAEISSVYSPRNKGTQIIYLYGFDTEGLVDEQQFGTNWKRMIKSDFWIHVNGTHTYQSVLRANKTVLKIEVLTLEKVAKEPEKK